MSLHKRNKIKSILHDWPDGMVATYDWLARYHISRQLINRYIHNKWIKSITAGAFVKFSDKPVWTGIIYALQEHNHLPIHVGGLSALHLGGYAHYPRFHENLFLYGTVNVKLPTWVKKISLDETNFKYRATGVFGDSAVGLHRSLQQSFQIICSTPERAILEVLAFVPNQHSYEEAAHLMENLMTLRPPLINDLLSICHSIKAKRLFLHLAEQCHAPWLSHLNLEDINLGSGIRVIANGHRFDKKYQLYIPDNPLNEGVNEDE